MTRTIWMACILGWMAAGNAAAESVDQTRPAAAKGVVSIDNLSGSVHVTGWSRKEVQVKGTLGKDVEKLIFEGEGERTRIEIDLPEHVNHRNAKSIESHLEVSVPAGSDVRIEASVDADALVMRVRDQGAGVPVERRTRIFARYVRGGPGGRQDDFGKGLEQIDEPDRSFERDSVERDQRLLAGLGLLAHSGERCAR